MAQYYTNGGELIYTNGDNYIGYYHFIEDDTTPYSGATQTPTSQPLEYTKRENNKVQAEVIIPKFNKKQYEKKYNTDFNELIETSNDNNIFNSLADENTLDISKFFDLYNKIFYDIPKNGQVNSHEILVKQSSEYINFTPNQDIINSLQEEITNLREQLLQEQQNNTDLLNSINQ